MKWKDGKGMPFRGPGLRILTTVTILTLTCLLALDMETVLGWARRTAKLVELRTTTRTGEIDHETPLQSYRIHQSTHDRLMNVTHDPTCMARTQHLLYRRDPDRLSPSPAFTTAWDRYVTIHKECSHGKNWTDVFLHQRGLQEDHCKYLIVMEGEVGLGNKLLSLTTAFAFALATDRVVLVEGRNQFKDLLCDPFPESSWFLPEDFPYQNVTGSDGLSVAIAKKFTDVDMVLLHLEHVQSWADGQFFCDHTHMGLTKVRWLGWTSNQYFMTRLLMVPSLWERLNPLFAPEDSFTILSHKLLLPKNELWAQIVRLYFGYFAGSSQRLGVQVRLHGRNNPAEFDPVVFDRIMHCFQSREVLPKLKTEEDGSDLLAFARNGWEGTTEISVLVTSLQLKYYDEIKDSYASRPNVNNTVLRFHMISHLGNQDHSAHQSETAFVEMWMLSFSDVLLISSYSTFGYIPQGLGGLKPLYLNTQQGDVVTNATVSSCYGGVSSQPCTHFPQKPKCEGASDADALHSEWMRHHIRECVDHTGGLQLVDEVDQPNSSSALWEHSIP